MSGRSCQAILRKEDIFETVHRLKSYSRVFYLSICVNLRQWLLIWRMRFMPFLFDFFHMKWLSILQLPWLRRVKGNLKNRNNNKNKNKKETKEQKQNKNKTQKQN